MIKLLKSLNNFFYFFVNYLTLKYRHVKYSSFPKINGLLSVRGKGKLQLGNNIIINSGFNYNPVGLGYKTSFHISPKAKVSVGDNVGISNCLFYSINEIIIEDNVTLGGGCQFLDSDFHSLDYNNRILGDDKYVKSGPILVKNGSFIGTSCIILKNVTIGSKSIVAAGSVVSKSIPDNEIWGGNPIKFIRKIE
jgi:acetyltransferase-like isoleucine patch superfamily enzyme